MFCANCGSSLSDQSRFCNACGTKVLTQAADKPGLVQTDLLGEPNLSNQANLIEKLIGKNAAFYMNKWARPGKRKGWNWAAFLLGPLWMGYRKMYKDLIMILSIYYVAQTIVILIGLEIPIAFGFIINIIMGLSGNAYYQNHINKQQQKHLNNPSMNTIEKIGGTSWGGVFISIGLMLLGALISASITGF